MQTPDNGYMGRVLRIDLASRQVSEYPWGEGERRVYLGGKIMAAKILYDSIIERIDPLGAENMLVITTGPLTGTGAPSSSRFNISTISPLTGLLASSNCGGNFGLYLKKAGYDGLVIEGRAEKPVWIDIQDSEITFHDAGDLWGRTTGQTQELLPGPSGKMVIGPAGENLVKYAGIFSEERTAGRAGVGAVMGSKNLKAVVARGTHKVAVHDPERVKRINKAWTLFLRKHPLSGPQLTALGTAGLLANMNARKMLATRNYSAGQFKDFEKVSGEYLAEHYLVKNRGCVTCPIQCGRVVEVDGKAVKGPELETLGLLGPNIENGDLERIIRWNHELDELGMDTITAGGTIAFAMELNERGLWDNGLFFGKTDNLSQVFQDIAYRRGIGDLLAEGSKRVAERFGGRDFAINVKGLELAAYEPRGATGMGLGYAVSNRGACHLNGGYMVAMEGLALGMDPHTHKSKAAMTILMQNVLEAISASANCLFTSFTMLPPFLINRPNSVLTRFVNGSMAHSGWAINLINRMAGPRFHLPMLPVTKALTAVTGTRWDFGRFKRTGERGYTLERLFNARLGVSAADDDLPARLKCETQTGGNNPTKVPLDRMKREYYRLRGWTPEGMPGRKLLRKLGLL